MPRRKLLSALTPRSTCALKRLGPGPLRFRFFNAAIPSREEPMSRIQKLAWLGLLTGCVITPAIAMADNCTGHWSNTTVSTDTLEIEKNYTLTFFHARGNSTSENSFHTGVGMCGGYALTTPDGKTYLAGICTRQGKDGGWSDAW